MHACVYEYFTSVLYRRHIISSLFGCCDVYFLLNLTDPVFNVALWAIFLCALSCLLPRLFFWFNTSSSSPVSRLIRRLCQWNIYLYSPRTTVITHLFVLPMLNIRTLRFSALFRVAITQSNVKYTFRELLFFRHFWSWNFIFLLQFNPLAVLLPCRSVCGLRKKNWYKQSSWNWNVQSRGKAKNCNFQSRDLYCFIQ